jgi:2-dehydro-3-deoxyglucarate aldolase
MPFTVRSNRIKSILRTGGAALGFGVLTCSPDVVEAAGWAGVDFVWLDLEHSGISPYDSSSLQNLVRAAESAQLDIMVRLPSGDESIIGKVLDTGVHSILIPGVDSSGEVEKIIAASKYFGSIPSTRGAGLARAGGWAAPDTAFAEGSDSQVMVGVMVESKKSVQAVDRILSVKGLDFAFVGPVDLSVSMGFPFETTNQAVKEAIDMVRGAAIARDIPLGITTADVESAKRAIVEGFKIIRIGVDLPMMSKSLSSLVKSIRA